MMLRMVVTGVRVDVQRRHLAGSRQQGESEQDCYHRAHIPSVCNAGRTVKWPQFDIPSRYDREVRQRLCQLLSALLSRSIRSQNEFAL